MPPDHSTDSEEVHPAAGIPWEAGPSGRGLRGALATCTAILLRPTESIHSTRLSGELWNAFAYYLGMMMGATLISNLVSRLMFQASSASIDELIRTLEGTYPPEKLEQVRALLEMVGGSSPVSLLFSLTFWFMFLTIYVFAAGAFLHLCLMLVGAASGGFEASFKALAYSHAATAPLLLVPFCGGLIHLVWLSVVLVVALIEWHRTTTLRVIVGLSLPLIPLVCCFAGAFSLLLSQWGGTTSAF